MSDNDRIIRFPSAAKPGAKPAKGKERDPSPVPGLPAELAHLSEDQRKALGIVMSGMPFVLVGIKPTGGGADFFTALHGEDADLRNARDHLAGVIERAYGRKGL